MNDKFKLVLASVTFIVIILWQRLGNLSELIHENGVTVLSISCLVILFGSLLIWIRSRSIRLILILPIILSSVPISFLVGNPLDLSIRFLIIYSVGTIALFLIFQKELKKLSEKEIKKAR